MKDGHRVVPFHIRDAPALVLDHAKVGEAEFLRDVRTQDAVSRGPGIVDGAVERLPPEFRDAHPHGRRIIGFRDVVIHHYDKVDLHAVWRLAERDVPLPSHQIRDLLDAAHDAR